MPCVSYFETDFRFGGFSKRFLSEGGEMFIKIWIVTEKNGFVTATKLETTNKIFVPATKNFAAATKHFVDRTKHFVVVT